MENKLEIIYKDEEILVCVKPFGVLSTDESGGMPELARMAIGDTKADVRTVHRLDQVVGGLMLLARSAASASVLSAQIREGDFAKEYLAVVHGETPGGGTLRDLLIRDKAERKTYVTDTPAKGVQEAVLDYERLGFAQGLSKVHIVLRTGRTHQIRCQFSSRNFPLVGDRKYSHIEDACPIALWSCRLCFTHPLSGEKMNFSLEPPGIWPWTVFSGNN